MLKLPTRLAPAASIAAAFAISVDVNAPGTAEEFAAAGNLSSVAERAEQARDRLTNREEQVQMPLRGQGYPSGTRPVQNILEGHQ